MGDARAQPLAILPPVRRWWALWLRLSWLQAEHVRPVAWVIKRPLRRMRFIHFAHWGIVTRIGGRRLPQPYIVFTTNFNGDADAYIDAFSILIPWRMRAMWQGAYGFPGPTPLGAFRTFIFDRVVGAQHFHCAYPDASLKMVLAGLALEDELPALVRHARAEDDAAFARRWAAWVAEHGNAL